MRRPLVLSPPRHLSIFLQFDGEGGWSLDELDTGKLMTLNEEKAQLETELAGFSKIEERLREVRHLLGESKTQPNSQMTEESLSNLEAPSTSDSSDPRD